MHYSLLLHFPERPREDLTPEEMRNGMNYFDRFAKELDTAGVLVSAELFERSPETVTVRLVNETIEELEGPEEEAHAPLGGARRALRSPRAAADQRCAARGRPRNRLR